ncbi:NADP-dependent oxidoreductase [Streptosporangium sp. NBC_01756]|uniref:NADP-dependent oxidoreductase n=1 Tax=Streptosporangium sp. NBC_01756 TaxID=2975950 RepID=UPI002DDB8D09|nr:NADP-dependent oxidoreductase [Streptosporangium sp. NBC_01756]WSC88549.1 NADP-dependent oxidoreductase [Streptosporangium sp. NBC_01756]
MRAIQIDRHGGPEVLTLREVPEPVATPGTVLVRTIASSLNPVDWKTRAWDIGPAFPMTLGWDLAGIVISAGTSGYRPGDRVIAMSAQVATGLGTWADLVALPERLLAPAPAATSLTEAATLPLAGLTALQALARIRPARGDRLLVTGAAGGVGGLAVQLARRSGAVVDGLVSTAAHVPEVRSLGAETVVHDPGMLESGVYHAVFDTAGAAVEHALAPGGRYVAISDDPLPDVPGAAKSYVQEDGRALAELAALVDSGELRLRVAEHHPVHAVRHAHERFERGGLLGKVVLTF